MKELNKIFGIKEKSQGELRTPERQSIEQTEDYAIKQVIKVRELEALSVNLPSDNSTADVAYVPMVLYNTDATPPAANTVPIGTIYIQYTP